MHFISRFGKTYGTKSEYEFRSAQFKKNLAKISAHPKNSTSKVGINKFADYTDSEWNRMLGYKGLIVESKYSNDFNMIYRDLPDKFDWRDKGAVTPVKD